MTASRRVPPYYRVRPIDDSAELMEQSYSLRYQVYCRERNFLPPEDYPNGLEQDAFDGHSVHVGVLDPSGQLVATGRVVRLINAGPGLPLFRHCRIFANETELIDPDSNVVEISRVAMSRRHRRRRVEADAQRREVRGEAFLTLLKGLYHATKRIDATHWLAAVEKPLHRLLQQHGFPFRMIGPEANYAGPVAPYLMSLSEFDAVIVSRRVAVLDDFLTGLEPEFHPRRASEWPQTGVTPAGAALGHESEQLIATCK
jgi:N-acyl amino acid synthase of PEP-CTERM/exosortase system